MKSMNARRIILLAVLVGCLALTVAGCQDPFAPDKATIIFRNRAQHATYDCILDGARIGAISPDHTIEREVATGSHTVAFMFANTNNSACSTATPNLAAGATEEFSCSTDLGKDCDCGD